MRLSKICPITVWLHSASSKPITPFIMAYSDNTTVLMGQTDGCTAYYVPQPGATCISVAEKFGINVATFMTWNPKINLVCSNMLAGSAYCVALGQAPSASPTPAEASTTTLTVSLLTSSATPISNQPTRECGSNVYRTYSGDGSTADGWPSMSEWVDFDCMFRANVPLMQSSCSQWGVARDSATEIAGMKNAIRETAHLSGIDKRFILAVIMQESQGCVRVITTRYSVFNPGLMQSHNGSATCNSNMQPLNIPGTMATRDNVQHPCPYSEIQQMIHDGTVGTSSGDGLMQLMQKQGNSDSSRWYRTARMYNGGSIQNPQNLNEGCCTASYASDIANRLTGWTTAPREFIP